jgi:hypothetical protein
MIIRDIMYRQSSDGITTVKRVIGAEHLLAVINKCSSRRTVPGTINNVRQRGILSLSDNNVTWLIDLARVSPQRFDDFVKGCSYRTYLEDLVQNNTADVLKRFLLGFNVASLSTFSKDDMVKYIVDRPNLLYQILTNVEGYVPQEGRYNLIPFEEGQIIYGEYAADRIRSSDRLDFWELSWSDKNYKEYSLNITTKTTVDEIIAADIPENTYINLRPTSKKPGISILGNPSIDIASDKIQEIADKLGVARASSREAMLDRVLGQYKDQDLAIQWADSKIYFSFDAPLWIGTPMNQQEILGLAKYIRIKHAESISSNPSIYLYYGVVDPTKESTEFQSCFRARPKVWAVKITSEIVQ